MKRPIFGRSITQNATTTRFFCAWRVAEVLLAHPEPVVSPRYLMVVSTHPLKNTNNMPTSFRRDRHPVCFWMHQLNTLSNQFIIWLVVGTPTPLKNDGVRQLGWLFPIYGKIIQMFQTTNQILLTSLRTSCSPLKKPSTHPIIKWTALGRSTWRFCWSCSASSWAFQAVAKPRIPSFSRRNHPKPLVVW